MPPESPAFSALDAHPSHIFEMCDDSEFQLLLEFLGASAAVTAPPVDGIPASMPSLPKSPFEAASDGSDAFDLPLLRCGRPLPQSMQAQDSDSQVPLPSAVPLVGSTSGSAGAASSLLRPMTPQKGGPLGSRHGLMRCLISSRKGSSDSSAAEATGDASSDRTAVCDPATARRARRSGRISGSTVDGVGLLAVAGVPSTKRRAQNREAQQRRRQRLKVRHDLLDIRMIGY